MSDTNGNGTNGEKKKHKDGESSRKHHKKHKHKTRHSDKIVSSGD